MASTSSSGLSPDTFDETTKQLQAAALKATRTSASLPLDIGFHRTIDANFAKDLDGVAERVLGLTNRLLGLANGAGGKGKRKLESEEDVLDRFQSVVVDVVDGMFERTDTCLDEFLGRNKAPKIVVNPVEPKKVKNTKAGYLDPQLQHAATLRKPQLSFTKKPENNDNPWIPGLKHKYHARVPLGAVVDVGEDGDKLMTTHPYYYETTHLTHPPQFYQPTTPTPPLEMSQTPFTWVNTPHSLTSMIEKLKKQKEIAVDLEHHSYRSYLGFLCLMQVSTREEDFVVDLLAEGVREGVGELGEVFCDPNIVKVFHGAESDIVWLQQDFDLYVVNLFDTFHASKLLDFPRHGLANLLEMYCDFVPDKRYQLADWRIRPLPEEMLQYARSDTHFLLYIYDNLRNALLDRGLSTRSRSGSSTPTSSSSSSPSPPQQVFPQIPMPGLQTDEKKYRLLNIALARSAETSLRVYQKETYDEEKGTGPGGWDTLARKWNKPFLTSGDTISIHDALQREIYRAVHGWRERVAREEDESVRFVLSAHAMFAVAEAQPPPGDVAGLVRLFRGGVPPVVKRRGREVVEVVRRAVEGVLREQGEKGEEREGESGEKGDVMQVDGEDEREEGGLWNRGPPEGMTAPTSALLGPKEKEKEKSEANTKPLSTASSALFGDILRAQNGVKKGKGKGEFEQLFKRISSTFVIAPSIPIPVHTKTEVKIVEKTEEVVVEDKALGMQVEVPFIPAAQRQVTNTNVELEVERDGIVLVGQVRKKRKRVGKGSASASTSVATAVEGEGGKEDGEGKKEEEEGFDFSSVPNLLDENPEKEEQARRKRVRKAAGNKKGAFYGDFPAPPKAISEVKSGNQTHTFR